MTWIFHSWFFSFSFLIGLLYPRSIFMRVNWLSRDIHDSTGLPSISNILISFGCSVSACFLSRLTYWNILIWLHRFRLFLTGRNTGRTSMKLAKSMLTKAGDWPLQSHCIEITQGPSRFPASRAPDPARLPGTVRWEETRREGDDCIRGRSVQTLLTFRRDEYKSKSLPRQSCSLWPGKWCFYLRRSRQV